MTDPHDDRSPLALAVAQVSMLALAVLVVYAMVAPAAGWISGPAGVAASAAAGALCLLGAGAALIAARAFTRRGKILQGLLVGMALRMGIPLSFGLALQLSVKSLGDAYLFIYLLVFYPVTLFVETYLSLSRTRASREGNRQSPEVAS